MSLNQEQKFKLDLKIQERIYKTQLIEQQQQISQLQGKLSQTSNISDLQLENKMLKSKLTISKLQPELALESAKYAYTKQLLTQYDINKHLVKHQTKNISFDQAEFHNIKKQLLLLKQFTLNQHDSAKKVLIFSFSQILKRINQDGNLVKDVIYDQSEQVIFLNDELAFKNRIIEQLQQKISESNKIDDEKFDIICQNQNLERLNKGLQLEIQEKLCQNGSGNDEKMQQIAQENSNFKLKLNIFVEQIAALTAENEQMQSEIASLRLENQDRNAQETSQIHQENTDLKLKLNLFVDQIQELTVENNQLKLTIQGVESQNVIEKFEELQQENAVLKQENSSAKQQLQENEALKCSIEQDKQAVIGQAKLLASQLLSANQEIQQLKGEIESQVGQIAHWQQFVDDFQEEKIEVLGSGNCQQTEKIGVILTQQVQQEQVLLEQQVSLERQMLVLQKQSVELTAETDQLCDQLQCEISQANDHIKAQNDQIEQSALQIENLNSQLTESVDKQREIQTELSMLYLQNKQLFDDNEQLQEKLEENEIKNQEYSQLESQTRSSNKQIQELTLKITQQEQDLISVQEQTNTAQQQLHSEIESKNNKIDEQNSQLAELQQKLQEYEEKNTDYQQLEQQFINYKSQIEEQNYESAQKTEQLANQQSEAHKNLKYLNNQLEAEIEVLQKSVDSQNHLIQYNNEQIAELQTRLDQKEQHCSQLELDFSSLKNQFSEAVQQTLQEQMQKTGEIDFLQQQLTCQQDSIQVLKNENIALIDTIDQLKVGQNDEILALKASLNREINQQEDITTDQRQELVANNEVQKNEISALKQQISELTHKLSVQAQNTNQKTENDMKMSENFYKSVKFSLINFNQQVDEIDEIMENLELKLSSLAKNDQNSTISLFEELKFDFQNERAIVDAKLKQLSEMAVIYQQNESQQDLIIQQLQEKVL